MEGKRLDLDAPLISCRRITTPPEVCERAAPPAALWPEALPFFNSDLNPGTIPFVWEKSPGQPKDSSDVITGVFLNPEVPKLPPGRSLKEFDSDWLKGASAPPPEIHSPDGVYFTECADAPDAISCAESFSMIAGTGFLDHSKRLTKDPQIKDFVMGRFLPAAQAMATGSHQRAWRKPPRAPVAYIEDSGDQIVKSRPRFHSIAQNKEDSEEEDNGDEAFAAGSQFFSSNGCGLIHRLCLKNPFDLLKPRWKSMPRIHNRAQIKALQDASLCQIKDESSWEAVYMHKLNHGYHPNKEEEKKLSESNPLTSWDDSQMLDGSSFLNSSVSTPSGDKHEDSKGESGSWRRRSSDSRDEDWETRYKLENLQETPNCKSSALTLSLPPPPLPTSPSESWLRRTLPSMSSKSLHPGHPSFSGVKHHYKKQVSWASSCDHKPITYEHPSNLHLP